MPAAIAIAPSLLSANPLDFQRELLSVEQAGADMHHVDVMDGHFVPNLSFGLPLLRALKKVSSRPLDVHIMVSNPDAVALDYVRAGADILTFHVEAARHAHRLIQEIKGEGAKAGVALNPGTPVAMVYPLLYEVDMVLIMAVNPGFSGQKFIPASIERIAELAQALAEHPCGQRVQIAVDGGITPATIAPVYQAGARVFVAGSAIYEAADRKVAIENLRHALC